MPAAARTPGRLVIDPIVTTAMLVVPGFAGDSFEPDIAYDASSNEFWAVWEYPFAATDHDIHSVVCNGNGLPLAQGFRVVESVTGDCRRPRVASLNVSNSWLVVMDRIDTRQVWGRFRPANADPLPFLFTISPLDSHSPDVGGDPAVTGACDKWLVVWADTPAAGSAAIWSRTVQLPPVGSQTVIQGPPTVLGGTPGAIYAQPSVSRSNGNGFTPQPCWMVVYQHQFSPSDGNIWGCSVAQDGTLVQLNTAIDVSSTDHSSPAVATPNTTAVGNSPRFLVTYDTVSATVAQARLLTRNLLDLLGPVNLTALFGIGDAWLKVESDGNRFALIGDSAGAVGVATIALGSAGLVLQEALQPIPGGALYPGLCSKRSAGGAPNDYVVVSVDNSLSSPDRVRFTPHLGTVPGAGAVSRRVMACNNLDIFAEGRPFLGETLTFSMLNPGTAIAGFVFGLPVPASTAFCAACPLGVDLVGSTILIGFSLPIGIPTTASLVGFSAAVQGFTLAGARVSCRRASPTPSTAWCSRGAARRMRWSQSDR